MKCNLTEIVYLGSTEKQEYYSLLVVGVHGPHPFTQTLSSSGGHFDFIWIEVWVTGVLGTNHFYNSRGDIVLNMIKKDT